MKIASVLAATVLATATFAVNAADKQAVIKVPVLMTDAQMKEVVAGEHLSGPGFGICTAVGFADAPGAIRNFGANANVNLPGNGHLNGKGNAPGFGQQTAGHSTATCGPIG
jgi:hypothetical protein